MLRKTLTLGMVFILALSLLAVSMITCLTYDAQADDWFWCTNGTCEYYVDYIIEADGWSCTPAFHSHG